MCAVAFLFSGRPAQGVVSLVYLDYRDIAAIRDEIKSGLPGREDAYKKLIAQADGLLDVAPLKVVDGLQPPTGDAHDFYTIGKYSWPNPGTPDGLPWIRRDCDINPEAFGDGFDLTRYNETVSRIKLHSLAWFYSGDEKYARKAAELLRVWFIDPETKMNPGFECASALPGVHKGMRIGIIFGVTLVELVDHVKLLGLSKSWTKTDDAALKKWFSDLTTWLLESEFGRKEAGAKDNHGSWYAAQVAAYSLYSGEPERVHAMVELAKKQMAGLIAEDGGLPAELKRDWSFHYSLYGLESLVIMARCAELGGEDLWNYRAANGRSMKAACKFMIPYVAGERKWKYKNTKEGEFPATHALPMVRLMASAYRTPDFVRAAGYLMRASPVDSREARLTGLNPATGH
ncbi:alginate lyase family protein [Termitidicoccus mucosus]|uniref:alginate lyase family protein n=1 Tax=Termitidicoccus mucosus TaxID=1184151 RepID=UPI002FEDF9B9